MGINFFSNQINRTEKVSNKSSIDFFCLFLGLLFISPKLFALELCREQLNSSPSNKRLLLNTDDKIVTTEGLSPIFFIDIDSTSFQIFPLKKELSDSKQALIEVTNNGHTDNYIPFLGIGELIEDLEQLGFIVAFSSASTSDRNVQLLQKAKIPNSTESIYHHVHGRIFNGDSSHYNFNPNNLKDPEILKTFPKQLLDSILGKPPSPQDRSPQANDFRNAQRNLRENSIFLDDLFGTNKHQIFIPSPNEGGPPAAWPQRRAYVLGVLSEAINLALNESKSLGSAIQKVLDLDFSGKPISKALSPQEKWQQNYFYFVSKGMIFLKTSKKVE